VVLRRSWGAPCLKLRQDATVHSMRFKTTCPVIFGRGAQLEKKAGTIENKQDEDGLTASKTDHHSLGIFHAQLTHRYLASSPFVSSDSSVTTVRCYSLPLDSSRVWCRFPASALLLQVPLPFHFALFFADSASLLVASSSSAVSTAPPGRCTYRTTEPRMNMSFVEHCAWLALLPLVLPANTKHARQNAHAERTRCGHLSSSVASALSNLMFRYWSTLFSVPRMHTSFLSSTVISESTSVLKKLCAVIISVCFLRGLPFRISSFAGHDETCNSHASTSTRKKN
jgi:hypothetical protein